MGENHQHKIFSLCIKKQQNTCLQTGLRKDALDLRMRKSKEQLFVIFRKIALGCFCYQHKRVFFAFYILYICTMWKQEFERLRHII